MTKLLDRYNSDKKIIFLHIPKAAGTTLNGIINQQYTRDTIFNLKGINDKDNFDKLCASKKDKIRILRGHMAFGLHNFLSYPCTYFTLLRNPIERVISHYYYIRNNPHYKRHKIAQAKSIEDYLMSQEEKFNDLSNLQTKLLCGTSQVNWSNEIEVLEMAKFNLENYFAVVGITEKFDETMLILQYNFDWNIPVYIRQNVSKNSYPSGIYEQTLKIIKCFNSLDIELYEYAKNMFETQLHLLDQTFSVENQLKINQLANQMYQPFGKLYSFSRSLTVKYLRKL
jgi:hypothetical protein